MFKRAGRKIKGLAIFFFVIDVLVFLLIGVGAIIIGAQMKADTNYLLFGLPISGSLQLVFIAGGAVFMIFGILAAWISALFIYGYGHLIDRVDDINEAITRSGRNTAGAPVMPAVQPAPVSQPYQAPVQTAPKAEPIPEPKPEPKPEPVVAPVTAAIPATVTCPNCGAAVSATMKFCPKCGTPMKN